MDMEMPAYSMSQYQERMAEFRKLGVAQAVVQGPVGPAYDSYEEASRLVANQQAIINGSNGATWKLDHDIISDTDICWSLNISDLIRRTTPRININLLQMKTGQLDQLLAVVNNLLSDPYDGLYNVQKVGSLTLPFFSNAHHSNQNEWQPLTIETVAQNLSKSLPPQVQNLTSAGIGLFKLIANAGTAVAVPARKVESPHVWTNTTLETIDFGFTLYNTSLSRFSAHKLFIDFMITASLPEKIRYSFVLPPVLCEYEIPGIRRGLMTALNFSVATKGQSTFLEEYGVNIPDAYDVSFSLTDLLMQTKNVYPKNGAIGMDDDIVGSRRGVKNVYSANIGFSRATELARKVFTP